MEGKGIITLQDGEKFVGYFKDGKQFGNGIFVLQNGEKFKEQF